MVSFEVDYAEPERHICHVRCNTEDVKPTNVGANSDCVETNAATGELKFYIFDGDAKAWVEVV